jgi:hypothetical protein
MIIKYILSDLDGLFANSIGDNVKQANQSS